MDITEEHMKAALEMFAPEDLHDDLVPYLSQNRLGGAAIYHPLVFMPFYSPEMNRHTNGLYLQQKKALERSVEAGDWHQFVFIHANPWRLEALIEVIHTHEIDDPEIIWPLVGSVWTQSETIRENYDSWREVWDLADEGNLTSIPRRELAMEENERIALAALPEEITIYRGIGHTEYREGFSWTTDRKRATWFAKRYSGLADISPTPTVLTGKVKKCDVLAHFLGRNEHEIVVLPESVFDIKARKVRK